MLKLARNFAGCLVRPVTSIAEKLLEKVLTYSAVFARTVLPLCLLTGSPSDRSRERRISNRTTPMKKQINPTIKAYLIRSGFYLLLLLAVCAIPFALAQSRSRGTAAAAAKSDAAAKTNQQHAAPPSTGAVGASSALAIPARDQSQLPKVSSGPMGVPSFRMPPGPKLPQVTLYDQLNSPGTVSSSSQDFETVNDPFDDFYRRRLRRAVGPDLDYHRSGRAGCLFQWPRAGERLSTCSSTKIAAACRGPTCTPRWPNHLLTAPESSRSR